jgi:hypothetical protein
MMKKQVRNYSPEQDPTYARGAADIVSIQARRVAGTHEWRISVATGVYTEIVEVWGRTEEGTLRKRFHGLHEKLLPGRMWDQVLHRRPGGDIAALYIAQAVEDHLRTMLAFTDPDTDSLLD